MKHLTPLMLLFSAILVSACGGNNSTTSETTSTITSEIPGPDPTPTETYDVIFMDGETVVKEYLDQTPGTFVDVPTLDNRGRDEFKGWTGLSDKAFMNKKVEVYECDTTYNAIWSERYGTDNVYDAVMKRPNYSIDVDGTKDSAYNDAPSIDIVKDGVDASAKAYVTYDFNYIYLFVEVTDSTKYPHSKDNQHPNSCDSIAVYLDLLHNESKAMDGFNGWGESYREMAMVEGWYKISRGYDASTSGRFNDKDGSDFDFGGWLSYASRNDGTTTVGTTKETDVGYNVEFKIDLSNPNVPDEYKPSIGNQFGLGIVLFDQTTAVDDTEHPLSNTAGIEDINLESEVSPKRVSNFEFKKNDNVDEIEITATDVRDCYEVSSNNYRDSLYKDASSFRDGGNTIEILHGNNKYYIFVTKGDDSSNVKLTPKDSSTSYDISSSTKIILDDDNKFFDFSYTKDGKEVVTKYFITDVNNSNNLSTARKMFVSKYTTSAIECDGELDTTYDQAIKFNVASVSITENAPVNASAVAYSMFDKNFLYLFIDVEDDNVDSTSNPGGNSPELNDSVELWISTTQVLPTSSTVWGLENRPSANYCGEGLIRVRAGMDTTTDKGLSGFHYLYDKAFKDKALDGAKVATKLTTAGYTVEYKIPWADFKSKVSNGEVIDILIAINDGENNSRHGVVTTNNNQGVEWWNKPYALDHIKLAGM